MKRRAAPPVPPPMTVVVRPKLTLAQIFAECDPELMKGERTNFQCPSCTREKLLEREGRLYCIRCGFFVRRPFKTLSNASTTRGDQS